MKPFLGLGIWGAVSVVCATTPLGLRDLFLGSEAKEEVALGTGGTVVSSI